MIVLTWMLSTLSLVRPGNVREHHPPRRAECLLRRGFSRTLLLQCMSPFVARHDPLLIGPDISFRDEAEMGRAAESAASVENGPQVGHRGTRSSLQRRLSKGQTPIDNIARGAKVHWLQSWAADHWRLRQSSQKNKFGTTHKSEKTSKG